MNAIDIGQLALQAMQSRASERDIGQERSMLAAVKAFNALRGHNLSETDGWWFMVILKAARARKGTAFVVDDYVDGAAYVMLAGECESKQPCESK